MIKAVFAQLFGGPSRSNSAIRPWRVAASATSDEAVLADAHRGLFNGTGPDFRCGNGDNKRLASDFSEYRELLHRLSDIPNLRFRTFRDLAAGRGSADGHFLTLRHDVDGDIESALRMAELESAIELSASYYIHYGSRYYGDYWVPNCGGGAKSFRRDIFLRHEGLAKIYRQIESLGHEVGIHVNPYGVPAVKGMNGIEAMRTEIAWLRAQGLNITGCSGHSSKRIHGTDAMCVFKESGDLPNYDHSALGAEAFKVSLAELGLSYMADFFYWRGDAVVWSVRSQQRAAIHAPGKGAVGPTVSFRAMVDDIASRSSSGKWPDLLALHVHPMSFGARLSASRNDEESKRETAKSMPDTDENGVTRYKSATPYLLRGRTRNELEIQQPVVPNEIGMIDFSWNAAPIAGAMRILLVGDESFDTPLCGVAGRVGGWLRDASAMAGGQSMDARTLSMRGALLPDYGSFLALLETVPRFDAVVIAIGARLFDDPNQFDNAIETVEQISRRATVKDGDRAILLSDADSGLASALSDASLIAAISSSFGSGDLICTPLSTVVGRCARERREFCDAEDCRQIALWIADLLRQTRKKH